MLTSIEDLLAILKQFADAYTKQVQINDFNAKQQWAQKLQVGLTPLEQGDQSKVTDAQRLEADKAVADAWAKMSA